MICKEAPGGEDTKEELDPGRARGVGTWLATVRVRTKHLCKIFKIYLLKLNWFCSYKIDVQATKARSRCTRANP